MFRIRDPTGNRTHSCRFTLLQRLSPRRSLIMYLASIWKYIGKAQATAYEV